MTTEVSRDRWAGDVQLKVDTGKPPTGRVELQVARPRLPGGFRCPVIPLFILFAFHLCICGGRVLL